MIKRLAIGYIIIVVVFALVNWITFNQNSTSYLISDQLNKSIKRYDFLTDSLDKEEYHLNAKDEMPITISEFSEMINPEFARRDSIHAVRILKKDSLERYLQGMDSLSRIAVNVRTAAIKHFKDSIMQKQHARLDSINEIILTNDSIQMIRSGKYIERSHYEIEYAERMQQVNTYVINHYGSFLPDGMSCQIGRLNKDVIRLECEVDALRIQEFFLTHGIRDLISSFHHNRMKSVGLLDFIYYSICVSTTVSFGDIAPNDGWTRFLAIAELLLCMLLLAVLLDGMVKKVNNRK
jgi:hypothetical protein